jgi:outer membrane protein assembly factor BamB
MAGPPDVWRYTAPMRKGAAILLVAIVVLAGALYQFGGVRIALDGSGMWPRFVSSAPDYDALEADRARQRERPLPPPAVTTSEPRQPQVDEEARAPAARAEGGPVSSRRADSGPAATRRGYWPDFRGPNRDGRYVEMPIRTDWPRDGLPQLWKQPIGLGYASFVVADGRAFTIEQRRDQEVVAAYDVETGRELWTNGWEGEFVEAMGGDGPRATPTYHDGRLYALGALGEFRCLDAATGAVVWRRNILDENDARNLDWGMSAAPLIVDDKVVVLPGGSGGRSVVAYDRLTGELVWRSLNDRQAYTSPMLVTLGGARQILVVTASRAIGIAVEDGRLLWEYPWSTDMGINVAQPLLVGDDRVFVSAGYGHGAAMFEVGRAGDRFTTRTVWQNTRMKNKFTSSVLHRGHIYGLDEAILACIDASTGDLKWKGGRYGYGQLVLAGDHLVVLTEGGEVVLVRATPERHEELGRFQAIEGKTWNHPVIADGRLLVRNLREMAAFDIGAQ